MMASPTTTNQNHYLQFLILLICLVSKSKMANCQTVSNGVTEDTFGQFCDPKANQSSTVKRYTITDERNVTVQIINFGATITSIKVPDKKGNFDDIVMGFDNVDGYWSDKNPYFGATCGRVANRIGGAQFKIDDQIYKLSKNDGNNTLHGGERGYNKVMWEAEIKGKDRVIMTYKSPDGEEGFPGEVSVEVTFILFANGPNTSQLVITHKATTTKKTPINIVNHSYFNLAGHKSGKEGLYRHRIRINADEITEKDSESIPTGKFLEVNGTEYDLRELVNVGNAINQTKTKGFDDNFCIVHGTTGSTIRDNANVLDEESGRYMEVSSDQPGVQFYTHNNDNNITGKEGVTYQRHGAFCLETQNYPDAVNKPNFPNAIVEPEKLYSSTVIYLFGVTY